MYGMFAYIFRSFDGSLVNLHQSPWPGWQQSEVAACQQGVTLRAHPARVEELVGILLLDRLDSIFLTSWKQSALPFCLKVRVPRVWGEFRPPVLALVWATKSARPAPTITTCISVSWPHQQKHIVIKYNIIKK